MSKVLVETSARHLHVTREVLDILFGEGYELNVKKELSQPGQYLSNEKVRVVGKKSEFPGVSILGPIRKATQVEITLTDARAIGVTAPVRESGDIAGSGSCELIGPKGSVTIEEGVICAKRHIHLRPCDAEEFGVKNGDTVSVKIDSTRPVVYGDVVIRVSESFMPAMHIDVDECNAAGVAGEIFGEIIK